MLSSFPVAAMAGLLLGFLSGLGVGGGSLLVLWLTAVLQMEQKTAQGINLLFFLPAALCASLFRLRKKQLPWKTVVPAALAGSLTAGAFAWLAGKIQTELLKKLFGGLLLFTGFSELFRKEKGTGDSPPGESKGPADVPPPAKE